MIAASPAFVTSEARVIGALPVVWITLLPKLHDTGLGLGGEFLEAAYVAPDQVLCDYHGFALGFGVSLQMAANLGRYPSPAAVTWDWNSPGYTMSVWFRTARTLELLETAAWTEIAQGGAVNLFAFYQWQVEWRGVRCWGLAPGNPPGNFTAYAAASPESPVKSYAVHANHYGDVRTYLKTLKFTGKFPVAPGDVVAAGRLTLEAPESCDDLVAGDHTGLVLSNRQARFNSRCSTFIFANEPDWHQQRKKVQVEIGYLQPGRRLPDMLLMYLGKLEELGPTGPAVDAEGKLEPHTCEVYSKNFIADLLEYRIGLPDADGNAQPWFNGEYLAEATRIAGKPLVPPTFSADFEAGDLRELHQVNGLTIITDHPLQGVYSAQAQTTGGGAQQRWGSFRFRRPAGEMAASLFWRVQAIPATSTSITDFLSFFAPGGTMIGGVAHHDGKLWAWAWDGATRVEEDLNFDLEAYEGVRVVLTARWLTSKGQIKVWINNEECGKAAGGLFNVWEVRAGISSNDAWTVHLDKLRVYPKYHDWAWQVPGYPFAQIKTVYVDNVARQDHLEKLPALGAVNFLPVGDEEITGTVKFWVVKDNLHHPIDIVQAIVEESGAGEFLDAASFAAAKAATPEYRLSGCRFEDMTAAAAISEICSRCLIYFFMDHALIRVKPYLGVLAALPAPLTPKVNDLGPDEMRECRQTIRLDRVKKRVVVNFGWQERNPDLSCQAGDPQAAEGVEIDFTFSSPVASDNEAMAQLIANRRLLRLGAREDFDPIRLTWRGARNELAEAIRVFHAFLMDAPAAGELIRKEITLDPPRETILAGRRYLGES